MEPVARGDSEVIKARGKIHILQLSSGSLCDVSWNTLPFTRGVQLLSTLVSERLYHQASVTRHVTRGKRVTVPPNAAVQRPRDAV